MDNNQGNNITSNNQAGGITAGSVNINPIRSVKKKAKIGVILAAAITLMASLATIFEFLGIHFWK